MSYYSHSAILSVLNHVGLGTVIRVHTEDGITHQAPFLGIQHGSVVLSGGIYISIDKITSVHVVT